MEEWLVLTLGGYSSKYFRIRSKKGEKLGFSGQSTILRQFKSRVREVILKHLISNVGYVHIYLIYATCIQCIKKCQVFDLLQKKGGASFPFFFKISLTWHCRFVLTYEFECPFGILILSLLYHLILIYK